VFGFQLLCRQPVEFYTVINRARSFLLAKDDVRDAPPPSPPPPQASPEALQRLVDAVSLGSVSKVQELLSAGTIMVADMAEPLCEASYEGHLDVVKLLLEARADVTAVDKYGATPLHKASAKGHIDVVKLLVELGADVAAADKVEKTPLHKASDRGHIDVVEFLKGIK